jgi:hypothetical protein
MKVAFNRREETSGIFRKTKNYVLQYRVELTPEEQAAVNDPETGDMIIYDYYNNYTKGMEPVTVKFACRSGGGEYNFDSMADLIGQETKMKAKFKQLADHIRHLTEHGGLGESVEEF